MWGVFSHNGHLLGIFSCLCKALLMKRAWGCVGQIKWLGETRIDR